MSQEINSTPGNKLVLELDPNLIELDDAINVRPFTSTHEPTEQEQADLQRLVESIEANGQEQPVIVQTKPANGSDPLDYPVFTLVAGNRRLKAIMIINAGREESNQLKVKAILSDAEDAFRAAFDENDKRAAMSPMDKAMNFARVRELNNWTGAKGTKKLADYFGVSAATVIQHDKLLKLSESLQAKVHSGVLTAEAAFIASKAKDADTADQIVADAERDKLLAEEKSKREAEENEAAAAVGKGKKKAKKPATTAKTKTRQAKGGKKGVSAAQVKKAARAHGVKSSRSRKEILEWFESENGPAYNESVQEFFTYLLKWADGEGTERTLQEKFRTMLRSRKEILEWFESDEKGGVIVAAKSAAKKPSKPKK